MRVLYQAKRSEQSAMFKKLGMGHVNTMLNTMLIESYRILASKHPLLVITLIPYYDKTTPPLLKLFQNTLPLSLR